MPQLCGSHISAGVTVNDTIAVIAFVVFCLFVIANWMNKPRKK